jgi:hypothetical protein
MCCPELRHNDEKPMYICMGYGIGPFYLFNMWLDLIHQMIRSSVPNFVVHFSSDFEYFICGLFNDAINSSDSIAWMIG